MVYKVIYLLFVIAISFGGNIHLGNLTPRHIMVIIITFLCIANFRVLKKYYNKFFNYYFIYLLFSFVSYAIEDFSSLFFRNLFAQHFVAIICYFSVCLFWEKFKSLKFIIVSFLLCGIINAIVVILQYVQDPVAIFLGSLFVEENSVASRHLDLLEQGIGGYCLGLKGDAVHNGFFQMIMPFFLGYCYLSSSIKRFLLYKLYCLFLLLLLLISIYFIQERSCIILVLIGIAFYFYRYYTKASLSSKVGLVIKTILIFSFIFIVIFPSLLSILSESRFITDEQNIRVTLFHQWLNFISTHFIFGGMNTFTLLYVFPPHNIILNSFLEAGFFGALFGILLYVRQLILSVRMKDLNMSSICICCACLVYSLNSLFHNDSILSGDALCWMLLAMVVCQPSRSNYLMKLKR